MRFIILSFIGLLINAAVLAQERNVHLMVQSQEGRTVRALWLVKKWPAAVSAFDIKRKDGRQQWVKLNSTPIMPGIWAKKNLANVEADKVEENRLGLRMYRLIKARKLRIAEHAAFLQDANNNDNKCAEVAAMISADYDVALMAGFGFVDHTISQKTTYAYGLFAAGTDNVLDSAVWNYGQVPDLNAVTEVTAKATRGSKGIQMMWMADVAKMKAGDITGFNLYREGIRLNNHPIIPIVATEPTSFMWYDKSADAGNTVQYSISAVSVFGIEGTIKPYTYDPAEHPEEYLKAKVTEVVSIGYYFKEGTQITWEFPKSQERFIKGFYLEKDNMPAGYKRLPQLHSPDTRSFADLTQSQVDEFLRVRTVVVYNDKTTMTGGDRIYNYFPVGAPPPPLQVKVKSTPGTDKVTVKLNWDPIIPGDSMTGFYRIYMAAPGNESFSLLEERQASVSSYTYILKHGSGGVYRFLVSSVSLSRNESFSADTLRVTAPSFDLPQPAIIKAFADGSKAVVQWQYPNIPDLKGFRIFNGDTMVAGEQEVSSTMREYASADWPEGGIFHLTVRAVSNTGLVSEAAAAAAVTVAKKRKR